MSEVVGSTVISDKYFDNLSISHLRSKVKITLKMMDRLSKLISVTNESLHTGLILIIITKNKYCN